MNREDDLRRVAEALRAGAQVLRELSARTLQVEHKVKGGPVTEVDRGVNRCLQQLLVRPGEGWLSEETPDDPERLSKARVWVVDPLDGTREFVSGIPEWCISVALVEAGQAVAGGIYAPPTDKLVLGSVETGVTVNGRPAPSRACASLHQALVLASRSEMNRGEWERFRDAPFRLQPVGSVAYKLALVAAGEADATWTLVPKHEWDVAAGAALVRAAGGVVRTLKGPPPVFNQPRPRLQGLWAFSAAGAGVFAPLLEEFSKPA